MKEMFAAGVIGRVGGLPHCPIRQRALDAATRARRAAEACERLAPRTSLAGQVWMLAKEAVRCASGLEFASGQVKERYAAEAEQYAQLCEDELVKLKGEA